ncbi:DUF4097 family beta strand repeat-containing protein [Streptomyces sp. NPDC090025]|uniref:DUF4097 family beta strand repeat-containing protein n=1 Tax=Streptomyces sp. NPDC090025 TaxID=3365922 RepID=UPI0038352009
MNKFQTSAPVTAIIDIPAGRIELVAVDGLSAATVDVRPADADKSRDVTEAERIRIGFADGVLRIESPEAESKVFGKFGSLDVTVQLPAGSRVQAKAAAADLVGTGRLGDIDFEAAQGDVTLDATGAARLVVQAGDLTVGRLGGAAELRTQKGSLRVAEAVTGAVLLETMQGDISIGAAPGVSATLDAGTAQGRISNSLRNSDGAAAALNIRATTMQGDIAAHSN